MNGDSNLQLFLDQLETFMLNLERPAFQLQLITFLAVLFSSYFLSRLVWYQVEQRRASIWGMRRVNKRRRRLWWLGLLALRYLTYPVVGLISLRLIIMLFRTQNWFAATLVYFHGFSGWCCIIAWGSPYYISSLASGTSAPTIAGC